MKLRNEYEVTITPEGAWSIRHIHGEQCHQVAHGRVEETYNVMGRAEEAAQLGSRQSATREPKQRVVPVATMSLR